MLKKTIGNKDMKSTRLLRYLVEWGLLAILIYTPLLRATKGLGALTFTYVFILVLSCLWLLGMNRKKVVKFVSTPLNLPLVLFFVFTLFSTIFSINRGASLSELYKVGAFILLYFLLANNIRERSHFQKIIIIILGTGSIVAGYGIYEYFSHWPALREIASTFPPNPNSLAGYLLLIIPLAGVLSLRSPSRWLSSFGFLTVSLAYLGLLATHSRGGYLAFIGSMLFLLWVARGEILQRKLRLFSLLGILLVITISLVTIETSLKPGSLKMVTQFFTKLKVYPISEVSVPEANGVSLGEPISARLSTLQRTPTNKFITDRLHIWGRTLEIISDYPFFGTGLETYIIVFKRHKIPIPLSGDSMARYGTSARFAHNEYLQIAAESGLPSLIIFLWIIALLFRRGRKDLKERVSGNYERYLTMGLLSGLTGLLLHSCVDFVLRPPATGILFVYFAALIMRQRKETRAVPQTKSRRVLSGTLFAHLWHSFLIRSTFLICITFLLAGQLTLPFMAYRYYRKGRDYQRKKVFDKAISCYLNAQRLHPANDRYYKQLGSFYHYLALLSKEEKEFWLARTIEEYEKMVFLSPEDSHYRRDLGVIYWLVSQGENRLLVDRAIVQLKESLRIDPTFPFASCSLGVIYAKMGWEDVAAEYFARAVQYEPNYAEAHYNLGILYLKKGLTPKALREFESVVAIQEKNLFPLVASSYEQALLKFDYSLAHIQLGALYEKEGRIPEAKGEYEYILKVRPDFVPAKEALEKLER
jgi:tetratricopeptide (TPR) repeat protein